MKDNKGLWLAIVIGAKWAALRTSSKTWTIKNFSLVLIRALVDAEQRVLAVVQAFVELLC